MRAVTKRSEEERRKRMINEFEAVLEKEPKLLALFRQMREGLTDLKELGQKLGMDEQGVTRCRKRLARHAAAFAKRNGGRELMLARGRKARSGRKSNNSRTDPGPTLFQDDPFSFFVVRQTWCFARGRPSAAPKCFRRAQPGLNRAFVIRGP